MDEAALGPTPEEIAMEIMESEQMMWLMVGSNHTEGHLRALRPAWDAYLVAGGEAWPYSRKDPRSKYEEWP